MNQPTSNIQEQWLKVLGKGMVTLPKKWRDEMALTEGDIIKAKKQGQQIIIEPSKNQTVPYRVFSRSEIEEFLKDDQIAPK